MFYVAVACPAQSSVPCAGQALTGLARLSVLNATSYLPKKKHNLGLLFQPSELRSLNNRLGVVGKIVYYFAKLSFNFNYNLVES